MKNKNTLIIIAIFIILAIAGVFLYMKSKPLDGRTNDPTVNNKSVVGSVRDALTQKLTLTCEFTDEEGTIVKSYIKNGAVRISSTKEGREPTEIIMKDNKMYIWDTETHEGFVYEIEDETEDSKDGVNTMMNIDSNFYLDMIDQYKDSCKVGTVDDSYFVQPSNIKFQDMAEFLNNLQNQAPQIETPNE
jgi:hypothetical protein